VSSALWKNKPKDKTLFDFSIYIQGVGKFTNSSAILPIFRTVKTLILFFGLLLDVVESGSTFDVS
jgi:hypothetical protein